LNGRVVHADDFIFHLNQHFFERLLLGPTLFRRQGCKPLVALQLRYKAAYSIGLSCEKHIDAFMGQQYRAFQLQVQGAAMQRFAQRRRIGQRREQIGRDIEDAGHGGRGQCAGVPIG
jgi:hypothetical protein